jgi:hypothetical protein
MRRHVIAGRFGRTDVVAIPIAGDERMTLVDMLVGKSLAHGIGQALRDMADLNLGPTELAVDFMLVAAHVHAADTRIARASESQDGWSREIRLVVPVSDPERWNSASPILERMLRFLTGDLWRVGFRSRPGDFVTIAEPKPKPLVPVDFDCVGLFSGGLDSLVGAIDILKSGSKPLLVSHAGEGAVSKSQEDCFSSLKDAFPTSTFDRLRIWMAFRKGLIDGVDSEDTTRGRSFLFFSLGVAAGVSLGQEFTLNVPENGLIALNVPMDPLRLGALSTRTTHPFYMARWNELLTTLDIRGRLVNPYWDKTKGEMVAACSDTSILKGIVSQSLSCSSPTKGRWDGRPQGHCGYCLPCLIRRASLLGDDPTSYGLKDLRKSTLDTTHAEGQQVRSFQLAARRVAKRPELAGILIHKPGPLKDYPDRLDAYADVYRRGLAEVDRLLAGVTTAPT